MEIQSNEVAVKTLLGKKKKKKLKSAYRTSRRIRGNCSRTQG